MPRVAPGYKDDVRSRIMRAALEEVNASGLQALRMEDIATRVGISRATLYNYFQDKGHLLASIIAEMQGECQSFVDDTFQRQSLKENILMMFDLMVSSAQEMPSIEAELFSIASRTPDIQQSMQNAFEEGLKRFADQIREKQASGEITSGGDPHILAEIVFFMLGGMKNSVLFGTDIEFLRREWVSVTNLLFFGGDGSAE